MLVLSRKIGEALAIGDDVIVEVVLIDGDRVRLGIHAPKDTRIFRRELLEETAVANRSAANAPKISFKQE